MFRTAFPERIDVAGASIELMSKGDGPPLLFLHAGHGVDADDALVERLSRRHRVIVPSHPGFGASSRPAGVTGIDDICHVYLDLIEALDLKDLVLVGVSFGAWIAAELATMGTGRIKRLVLIDAVGVKVSGRETRDIKDIFGTTVEEIPDLFFHDPEKGKAAFHGFDFKNMSEEDVTRFVRNRESLLLFGWSPTLYNPKLLGRLHRVKVPVLLLWGEDDKVVGVDYGRRYAAAFPGATFEVIEGAGHYGYLEQPDEFAGRIDTFLAA
ncbi:alpha/beta fold hydrolase [Niveispirillum sp. KHB5.9]|uniref:alpha/beta fold hydrolase n=1 Tax=Niveispirillum sp. KHB5.9 TaxID=3400269 RepID=UPI003A8402D2